MAGDLVALTVELIFALIFIFYFASLIRGAPYVPTRPSVVERAIALAKPAVGQKAIDLGSGDGRVLIALARRGVLAQGWEINPFLVFWSRFKIHRADLNSQAAAHWGSFWRVDLSAYDLVFVYGLPRIMGALSEKLRRELKPGAVVVSHAFSLPGWTPETSEGGLYLYRR